MSAREDFRGEIIIVKEPVNLRSGKFREQVEFGIEQIREESFSARDFVRVGRDDGGAQLRRTHWILHFNHQLAETSFESVHRLRVLGIRSEIVRFPAVLTDIKQLNLAL